MKNKQFTTKHTKDTKFGKEAFVNFSFHFVIFVCFVVKFFLSVLFAPLRENLLRVLRALRGEYPNPPRLCGESLKESTHG